MSKEKRFEKKSPVRTVNPLSPPAAVHKPIVNDPRFRILANQFDWLHDATELMKLISAGQLQLPITGSGAGLLIGGDVNLYRSAANVLRTDDNFEFGTGSVYSYLHSKCTGPLQFKHDGAEVHFFPDEDTDIFFFEGRITPPGRFILSTGHADETNPLRETAPIILVGKYWDGLACSWREAKIIHNMLSTTPTSQIGFEIADSRLLNILDDGKLDIGGAGDVNLYRSAANVLKTDDVLETPLQFYANAEGAGVIVDEGGNKRVGFMKYSGIEAMLIGDASLSKPIRLGRWNGGSIVSPTTRYEDAWLDSYGNLNLADERKLKWSDVNLYRSAANVLKTNDEFRVYRTFPSDKIFSSDLGTAYPPFDILVTGKIEWGPGNAAPDVNLYRSAANVLKTDEDFETGGNITIADGKGLKWSDVDLYRGAADKLKTDGSFDYGGGLYQGGTRGIPEDDIRDGAVTTSKLGEYGRITLSTHWRQIGSWNFFMPYRFPVPSGKTMKLWAIGSSYNPDPTKHVKFKDQYTGVVKYDCVDGFKTGPPYPLTTIPAGHIAEFHLYNSHWIESRDIGGYWVISIE